MASSVMVSMSSSVSALRNSSTVQNNSIVQSSNVVQAFSGLKPTSSALTLPALRKEKNYRKIGGCSTKIYCMKTWSPIDNRKYETLSYLPALTEESIIKEIEYIVAKGWIPCLEFDAVGKIHRANSNFPGYYDGRFWTLWKLPMFGCTDGSQVLAEMDECKKTFPNCYIRCLGFDNQKQTQCVAFIVHKPQQ
ncbi:hypothetical protein SUGI_0485680 [Cryptomeria japonica]|uniref:ribulose bisphosphate carboxylase small subunit, chloroplastic 3 n=1 Tax=Cryptomeria japonica TaxID=3369 RepID=UPI002408A13E|nr:ribulose bisphosphate carboxylase small subunit, chloroplastic 3 [Cryptomeria japonica]GLJ25366.1 hypothetical protein SUGI_0485680 [Cryptomeria japonica]